MNNIRYFFGFLFMMASILSPLVVTAGAVVVVVEFWQSTILSNVILIFAAVIGKIFLSVFLMIGFSFIASLICPEEDDLDFLRP